MTGSTQQYNPSSTLNGMMMSNHIMNHFNRININKNSTGTIISNDFFNETYIILIQILMTTLFTGLTNYFSLYFEGFTQFIKKIFNKIIFKILINPIIKNVEFIAISFKLQKRKK